MASKESNLELAHRIVTERAKITKTENGNGWIVDLNDVIGLRGTYANTKDVKMDAPDSDGNDVFATVATKTTKKEAVELATKDIAFRLDEGSIILSKSWAEDNLKNK